MVDYVSTTSKQLDFVAGNCRDRFTGPIRRSFPHADFWTAQKIQIISVCVVRRNLVFDSAKLQLSSVYAAICWEQAPTPTKTMEERTTEDRFDLAARHLCERWGFFDFWRRKPGSVVMEGEVRLLKSDIDRLGAIDAIKRRLNDEPKEDVSLELACRNRLDLTVESLSIRPRLGLPFR